MDDQPTLPGANEPPILSVSELSGAVKRTIEGEFGFVRLRAEISGYKRAASGHMYMTLKDADAAIDGVCWRGTASKLDVVPEDGLEVVVSGRVTTYPARSKYQFVIERMELAGEGALLKMIEERRKKLAAEGLFDEARKQPLPYLPEVIGVVTSPTGAVIRDILHRLADRFPRHVLLWPVLVQGSGAAEQVAAAIAGFNAIRPGGEVPRPDLLIVARGGGSLEDLMAFNEEIVVRAAAASEIPLISAVGHETDTTLIDHAADRRAPTPTAAAEIAVPVRGELVAQVSEHTARLTGAITRLLRTREQEIAGLARGLPRPQQLLETASQRADDFAERLTPAMKRYVADRTQRVEQWAGRLPRPKEYIRAKERDLALRVGQLKSAEAALKRDIAQGRKTAEAHGDRLLAAWPRYFAMRGERLDAARKLLESYSYKGVLERGFVLVRDAEGQPVTRADALAPGDAIDLAFRDDAHVGAVVSEASGPAREPAARKPKAKKKEAAAGAAERQGRLL